MGLVLVFDPRHGRVAGLERAEQLGGVDDGHSTIDASVREQQRPRDARRLQDGRRRLQLLRVGNLIADQLGHAIGLGLGADVAPADVVHQVDVGHGGGGHATPVQVGVAHEAHQCGVAAIAAAHDARAFRIFQPLLRGPHGRVGDVVLHLQAPLLVAGALECRAIPFAPAEFGFDDQVTARRQELRFAIPAPVPASHRRAAVHEHDGRPRALAVGLGHVDRQVVAVARLDPHEIGVGHLAPVDLRACRAERDQRVAGAVVQEEQRRLAIRMRGHQHALRTAAVCRINPVDEPGQARIDLGLQRLHVGIEPDGARRVGFEVHAQHLVVPVVLDQRTVDVEALDAHDGLGVRTAGLQVVSIQGLRALFAVELVDVGLAIGADAFQHSVVCTPAPGRKLRARLPRAGLVAHQEGGLAVLVLHRCANLPLGVELPMVDLVGPLAGDPGQGAGAGVHPHRRGAGPLRSVVVHHGRLGPMIDDDVATAVVQRLAEAVHVGVQRVRLDHRAHLFVLSAEPDQRAHAFPVGPDRVESRSPLPERRFGLVAHAEHQRLAVGPTGPDDVELGEAGDDPELRQVGRVEHRQLAPARGVAHEDGDGASIGRDRGTVHRREVEEIRGRHRRGRCGRRRGGVAGHGPGERGQQRHDKGRSRFHFSQPPS